MSDSQGRQRESQWWEMFQERIRIRHAERKQAMAGIARRSRNACGTRPDGRQRTRVAMTINRVRRNTWGKRCKSVTSWQPHAMPMRCRACRGRVNTDACACILSVSGSDAIREPIGVSARVVDDFQKE
ncbi:hypothetical protein KEC55_18780 [Burkholderia cepacia]|uniref:hypothetical protein n=1 Tax=Burkholderia cepacia TaxID=292 RepID=UPI00249E1EB4|nr:hypothetical protein [Burkholderia cepacia]WGY71864.1 hypothetical protein KEC55_18780 [Burkholderia cepacia]